ncbi:MAG: T9SS type A sorting domain-containing protein [Bacteroidales bacterium]|nr:T9SS type A sorting domain-containing protein [Bacteroidales bacterium]MCF8455734.1 T9SS type A sorting domain-containing protein [Bacteroidales bacterium]
MRKTLLFGLFILTFFGLNAQSYTFETGIKTTGGTATDTLGNGTVVTFQLSTDDAEQENDEVDSYYDDDLDAGWEGDPTDQNILTTGLRFTDVTIPAGAVIDSAFIVVVSHEGKDVLDVANITIKGEATDNAVTFDEANFNENYLLTDRPMTNASAYWVVDYEWIIWGTYRTNDLKTVVQEIVDRPGWASGNAMAFFLQGENQGPSDYENAREFESFENISDPDDQDPQGNPGDGQNHPERVPTLKVYYTANVGVQEIGSQSPSFIVSPNPTSQVINIRNQKSANMSYTLVDISGKAVKNVPANGQVNTQISVTDLDAGIYFIQGTESNHTYTSKVIIF